MNLDPLIYVPLSALDGGPSKVTKDKSDDAGFWTGSILIQDKRVEVIGFNKGPLDGLVKIPGDSLGK